jgi:hypothetical protein
MFFYMGHRDTEMGILVQIGEIYFTNQIIFLF